MADKLTMYVLTDTHYLSEKMWEEGESINSREMGDQIAIKSTPYILRSFFNKIIDDKDSSFVLITGDLINNGDLQSHKDFKEELKMLTDAGKTVLVTCATHDYAGLGDDENIFHPVRYTKDGTVPAERVYKTELPQLYYDFGHKFADSIDKESGSYSVLLTEGLRLIAIYDNGNGRSHCGLFDEGFNWLESEIKKANENGEIVFLAVHHPVVPPWPIYRAVADFEMFGGYERLRKIMCENSVKAVFTGHTHVHGIKEYRDAEGRSFYDITTSALPSAGGKMRKLVFDIPNKTCSVESIGIEKIDGFNTNGLSAKEYIYRLNFSGLIEHSLPFIKTDWKRFSDNLSHVANIELIKKHPHISKYAISKIMGMKMSTPARLVKKAGKLLGEDIKALGKTTVKDTAFAVLSHVFTGNAPFSPDTPEYKVVEGVVVKAGKILKMFKVDIDKLVPGEETALETVKHFMYNTRTGDDDTIIIDFERK